MTVTGTISQDELLAALMLERAGRRRGFLFVAAAAAIFGVASTLRGLRPLGLVLLAAAVGLLLSEFVSARVMIPWRSRRLYREGSAFRLPGSYEWTATHFLSRNERGEASLPWDEVRDVVENASVFLVRHRGGRLQIVPKSWFDEAAMASFRAVAPVRPMTASPASSEASGEGESR